MAKINLERISEEQLEQERNPQLQILQHRTNDTTRKSKRIV